MADNGANLAARDITFTRNPIQLAACKQLTVQYYRIARHRESQTLAVGKPAAYGWSPIGFRLVGGDLIAGLDSHFGSMIGRHGDA